MSESTNERSMLRWLQSSCLHLWGGKWLSTPLLITSALPAPGSLVLSDNLSLFLPSETVRLVSHLFISPIATPPISVHYLRIWGELTKWCWTALKGQRWRLVVTQMYSFQCLATGDRVPPRAMMTQLFLQSGFTCWRVVSFASNVVNATWTFRSDT